MQLVSTAGLVPVSARSLAPMQLYEPRTVGETLAALREAPGAALLAGGTDLVAAFNEGLSPAAIVSLAQVAGLRDISAIEGGLRIGAAVTHHEGCGSALVRAQAPGFGVAWSRIANPRIRFTATLGGNLMARRVRYEGSILASAIGARLEFAGTDGTMTCSPADLWEGRAPAQALLTALCIDTGSLAWYAYERSMRPLITLAACLRRRAGGLALTCAVATEYLRPALLVLELPHADLAAVAASSRDIARQAFAQLPAGFADPVVTRSYALNAGATLLARQLAGAAHV